MIVPAEILSYFYYITSDDVAGVIEDDCVVYYEDCEEWYTFIDIKRILLN